LDKSAERKKEYAKKIIKPIKKKYSKSIRILPNS
jgi:hypothetical protein